MSVFGEKFLDLLRYAAMEHGPARRRRFQELCDRYSEKAVDVKMSEMSRRGYLDYGLWPRGGWPTEKGKEVLERHGYT